MHPVATRSACQQWVMRLVVAVAVLAGLMGMHGLGKSAVYGCPGPASNAAASHHAPAMGLHAGHVGQHEASSPWAERPSPAMLHGDGVCQPILPGSLIWVPVLGCVGLLVLASLFALDMVRWRPRTRLRSWWRAPPWAGRVCLVRVCVSRT